MSSQTPVPAGFRGVAGNIGIKDPNDDFFAVVSEVPARVSAVFTRSRFAGPSVLLSRRSAADGSARGVAVIARNANVATGRVGDSHARELQERVARAAGVPPEEVLVASTGVIGRPYPIEKVRAYLDALPAEFPPADLDRSAAAMMTTDTRPKTATATVGGATLTGIAKGVGMIEPNMATMLAWFFTDAELEQPVLDEVFRRVVDRTFNALSIDTDTSTSDSAAVFANGLAGPVDAAEFEAALYEVALKLVRMIASDGEGASKLIEVRVTGARDDAQAKRVAKAVVNSPLVKTAVHGADPNWGRVTMAVGKCEEETDILPDNVRISFGDVETYPAEATDEVLERAAQHMKGDEVVIGVGLGIADGAFTVYGCDLTEGYIRINADYTT
ncbi:bifunctional glutamate N-acetyltransferase/amino-acid acetyltransferase ArgJ [Nocardiopsis sp. HUAS JQ3]|uniref:bifunctional glutamate N-acetyltransferase/amino-acid acetyltransferase ArgJ n=1 Tax=Nocardiopsis sp. HUAS JQ3 TaxID=3061629 RepID=UPI0023A93F82|nr:bifunctional glutamate N-acetyltransferase/amino-acid acetyltransferase ArgJ [Nocardiopsis sp. HUAS JQ3]WDZ90272.1 bifunctional glutamate N-acetyltransferase/amino-acid acetyltransferase ArgJ [Nocardiopsis sp. HUAS JQ3]